MTTQRTALKELREKVAAGTADFDWGFAASPSRKAIPTQWHDAMNAYLGSLDAAKSLHEALLGADWSISIILGAAYWDVDLTHYPYRDQDRRPEWDVSVGPEDNPARAWLLAIIDALIAQEAGG